jgi:hypothetical protein
MGFLACTILTPGPGFPYIYTVTEIELRETTKETISTTDIDGSSVEEAGSRQPAADQGTDQNNLLLVVDVDEEVTDRGARDPTSHTASVAAAVHPAHALRLWQRTHGPALAL